MVADIVCNSTLRSMSEYDIQIFSWLRKIFIRFSLKFGHTQAIDAHLLSKSKSLNIISLKTFKRSPISSNSIIFKINNSQPEQVVRLLRPVEYLDPIIFTICFYRDVLRLHICTSSMIFFFFFNLLKMHLWINCKKNVKSYQKFSL